MLFKELVKQVQKVLPAMSEGNIRYQIRSQGLGKELDTKLNDYSDEDVQKIINKDEGKGTEAQS